MTDLGRALDHCALEVRRYDYDRYLCAMFAEAPARNRLFALYALNLELARVAESVSEPALGEMRLQWWRDTLDGVYRDDPRDHPVAAALAGTKAMQALSRAAIDDLIDARARDLDDTPMATRDDLIHYAEGTSSSLLNLAFDALGIADEGARAAALPLGRAWALTGIIRATGHLAARQRTLLPADLTSRIGLTKRQISAGADNPALQSAISEVASWAAQDLAAARRERTPRDALPVMLLATLTQAYLGRLSRADFNPYDPRLVISPLARQIRLLVSATANRP